MLELRFIGGRDVRRLLTMARCIEAMRTAMTLTAQGRAVQPIRTAFRLPDGTGILGMMPGSIEEPHCFGIKVTSVFAQNFGTAFSSHQGFVVLFEPEHGSPVAIVDGAAVTAIRTAASSAVATDALARANASSLAIFGYGEQAAAHLEALRLVRRFDRIVVWGRSAESAAGFAREQAALHGVEIAVAESCEAAASSCDVLCTVTAAFEPFLEGEWLRPGTHLNVVGSSIPTTSEIDVEAVVRSRVFTDYTASALALAGDLKRARDAGAIDESHIVACVGDVLLGRDPGRRSPSDITMFKSLGMSSEDLVSADLVWRLAAEENAGVPLPP